MVDASYYRELLTGIFRNRQVVIFGLVLAGAREVIGHLRSLGASRCFVVADGYGTGELPTAEEADWIIVGTTADDPVGQFRAWERIAANPPVELVRALDRYDPAGTALVLAPAVTLGPLPERLAGRRFWGRRSRGSLALEDKSRIDQFWDATGIRRSPSLLVPLNLDAVRGACERLDRGAGTVWAGDAREGIHGGAHMVRWVQREDDMTDALDFFAAACDHVRIMPFMEGIPCSIHGIAFRDHLAALRPVEMVTLRRPGQSRFLYAGAATYWDPPSADREEMRSLAVRAGAAFRELAGLGTFTIDGVMTEEGFRPTEMNARYGAGLNVIARRMASLPLALLMQALQEGEPLEYRPRELEALLLQTADDNRGGGGWTHINRREDRSHEHSLLETDGGYHLATTGEQPQARLLIGPSSTGGFMRFTPEPGTVPTGASIAPRVVAAFGLADREFATGLGPLEAATDVRR